MAQAAVRDPTRPANSHMSKQVVDEHGLKLTSIISSARRELAVINGNFVKVGQFVKGAKVIRITGNRVYLSKSGQKIVLQLIPSPFTSQSRAVESQGKSEKVYIKQ